MTTTSTNVAGLDGGGKSVTLRAEQAGDNSLAMHSVPEVAGAAVSTANPMPVAGSVAPAAFPLTNSAAGTCSATVGAAIIAVPFSATRKWVMFSNRSTGSETIDVGSSNVAVGGGIPIAAQGGFLFSGAGAAGPIYVVSPVAGTPYSYVEG